MRTLSTDCCTRSRGCLCSPLVSKDVTVARSRDTECYIVLQPSRGIIYQALWPSSSGYACWLLIAIVQLLTHSRHQDSISPTYLLSWIPESLLDGRADWNKFVKAEKATPNDDSDDEGKSIQPSAFFIESFGLWYLLHGRSCSG